jgi:hypothetical protein
LGTRSEGLVVGLLSLRRSAEWRHGDSVSKCGSKKATRVPNGITDQSQNWRATIGPCVSPKISHRQEPLRFQSTLRASALEFPAETGEPLYHLSHFREYLQRGGCAIVQPSLRKLRHLRGASECHCGNYLYQQLKQVASHAAYATPY